MVSSLDYSAMTTAMLFEIARKRMIGVQAYFARLSTEDDGQSADRTVELVEQSTRADFSLGVLERMHDSWKCGDRDDASARTSLIGLLQSGD